MTYEALLKAHEDAAIKAGWRGNDGERHDHFTRVAYYSRQIRELRERAEAGVEPTLPAATPPPVIYGGAPARIESWEDEGGALRQPGFAANQ